MPSPVWVGSQLRCYQSILPPQLKRNLGGLDGLEESKRRGHQSTPLSPSFAPRHMTTLRFAILQEKDMAVAVAQAMSPSTPTWAPAFEAAHIQ